MSIKSMTRNTITESHQNKQLKKVLMEQLRYMIKLTMMD